MSARSILGLLLAAGAVAWLYTHRGTRDAGGTAPVSGSSGAECLRLGDQANEAVRQASTLLLRPPVDASAWASARSRADAAISLAEACGAAAATDADRRAWEPLKGALASMRSLLAELDGAARGGVASSAPSLQEQVDAQLEKARGALRS